MTISPDSEGITPHEIPTLDELISDFDNADLELKMAYGRYLEKPSPRTMADIATTSCTLYDELALLLQKIIHNMDDCIEQDEKVKIIATTLHNMGMSHCQLLADYSKAITVPTPEESHHAYEHVLTLIDEQAELGNSSFVSEVLGHFRSVLDTDIEVIEQYVHERQNSPVQILKERAKKIGLEMGKIAGAAVIGVVVADKLRKSS